MRPRLLLHSYAAAAAAVLSSSSSSTLLSRKRIAALASSHSNGGRHRSNINSSRHLSTSTPGDGLTTDFAPKKKEDFCYSSYRPSKMTGMAAAAAPQQAATAAAENNDKTREEFPLVSSILLSRGPHVHVRDPAKVESVLSRMTAQPDPAKRLQVLADFDQTLTRVHRDGRRLECSWGVIESSPLLPPSYTERTAAVKARYLPIERDPSLTVEEKAPHMEAWYKEANALLREAGANRSMFPRMVEASLGAGAVELRQGAAELLKRLSEASVPVLVLSAGLGDLLSEVLRQLGCLDADNLRVVSNFLAFDSEGNVTGIDGEMIHVFNKSEAAAVHGGTVSDGDGLRARDSVLLLGDSLGDLQMSKGCDPESALLTVGFLNVDPSESGNPVDPKKLDNYTKAFDVVLVDDQTVDVAAAVVDAVLSASSAKKQ